MGQISIIAVIKKCLSLEHDYAVKTRIRNRGLRSTIFSYLIGAERIEQCAPTTFELKEGEKEICELQSVNAHLPNRTACCTLK